MREQSGKARKGWDKIIRENRVARPGKGGIRENKHNHKRGQGGKKVLAPHCAGCGQPPQLFSQHNTQFTNYVKTMSARPQTGCPVCCQLYQIPIHPRNKQNGSIPGYIYNIFIILTVLQYSPTGEAHLQ